VQTEGFWPACVCMCVQTVSCARARCLIVRLGKVFELRKMPVLYSTPFVDFCRGISLVLNGGFVASLHLLLNLVTPFQTEIQLSEL
jgi:hypothetical protein